MKRQLDEANGSPSDSSKIKLRKLGYVYTFEYEWKVPKFSEIAKDRTKPFQSELVEGPMGVKWVFELSLDEPWNDKEDRNKLSVFARLMDQPKDLEDRLFDGKLSAEVMNSDFAKTARVSAGDWELADPLIYAFHILKVDAILQKCSGFLIDDQLTIVLKLKVSLDRPLISEQVALKHERLFNSKEFSDCVLVCNDGDVPAYKTNLVSQSPVFHLMFKDGTEEAKSGRVVITDVSCAVMKELCHFAACGKVDQLSDLAMGLLVAADKYDMPELKELCSVYLRDSMEEANVCDRLIFANDLDLDDVKNAAFDFIKKHGSKGIETLDNHEELFKMEHQKLLIELFSVAFRK